jgi:hypothetical protein
LGDERVERLEFPLVPDPLDEVQAQARPVEISVEIVEMRLDAEASADRRPIADIGDSRPEHPWRAVIVQAIHQTCVHAVRGLRFHDALEVRRRDANRATASVPAHDPTRDLVGAPEPSLGRNEIAYGDGGANSARRERSSSILAERLRARLEAELGAESLKKR